jgi:hypothetical protein
MEGGPQGAGMPAEAKRSPAQPDLSEARGTE